MFGYIRPYKPELTLRAFYEYRSVYCGLCKEIGRQYGELPRFAVTYDVTFWALFFLAFECCDKYKDPEMDRCVLSPLKKHPIMPHSCVMEAAADLTAILTLMKIEDDINDSNKAGIYKGLHIIYKKNWISLVDKYPDISEIIKKFKSSFSEAELESKEKANTLVMADLNGQFLSDITNILVSAIHYSCNYKCNDCIENNFLQFSKDYCDIFGLIGRWVYILDAVDDWENDTKYKRFNPFSYATSFNTVKNDAKVLLVNYEIELYNIASKLPYSRFGDIILNQFAIGLPYIREEIYKRNKLKRV